MNQLVNMFTRLFMRKIMNRSIDAGINYTTRRRGGEEDMKQKDHQQALAAKETAKKARKAAKLTRRLGRF